MMHGMMMHGFGMHESWLSAWPLIALGVLLKLTVWVLLITGLGLGVRWLWRESSHRLRPPLDVLKVRYAKGELSRQEFEAMRQELERP